MLDLEPIKERLAWVDEEGLNGYTWDIKDTYRQYRDLVAEVERLRDGQGEPYWKTTAEERAAAIEALEVEVERLRAALGAEAASKCSCYEAGFWCRSCWAHYTLTGEERESAVFPGGADNV